MTGLALALVAGAALPPAGVPLLPALLLPALLLAPIGASRRPAAHPSPARRDGSSTGALPSSVVPNLDTFRTALALAALAGVAASSGSFRTAAADCRLFLPQQAEVVLEGRFEGRPGGGAAPFRVVHGLPGGCVGTVRVTLREGIPAPRAGEGLRLEGRWRSAADPHPLRPEFSGTVWASSVDMLPANALPPAPVLVARGRVQERIVRLYGETAPVVEALILARKEGLDPTIRDAFAVSGTAHLLAISGFHVGVVAGLLFTLFRAVGASRERAALLAAVGAWGYVLSIGAPHAAARAATLVTALAASRLRGRPVHSVGALGAAALVLVVLDPLAPMAVGFQLSFAGAAGLVLLRRPLDTWVRARGGDRVPGWLRDGLVAGMAATVVTTPLVAWHFDRVSLVGIPATLVVGPAVALAIPGILASLVFSLPAEGAGRFLAGGVSLLLDGVEWSVLRAADLPWASPWVPRSTLPALGLGAAGTALLLRGIPGSRLRPLFRWSVVGTGALAVVILLPVPGRWAGSGELTLTVLDVGQGDAVVVRTPAGRWVVIDAGPRSPGWDAGSRVVLPHLRRQGARRIELLVLTHPHLDHVGGAEALLRGMEVVRVADPGLPAARAFYTDLLGLAVEDRVGWWALDAGESWELDGVELHVLNPVPGADTVAPSHGANSLSVVLELRYGAFRALLTGDAPEEIEEVLAAAGSFSPVHLLKVGHHGSRTSTGWTLLGLSTPEVAVVPAGRGNPFGHPHPAVLNRLERAGVRLYRTDRDGTVAIHARADGSYRVRPERGDPATPPPPRDLRLESPPPDR